MKTDNYLNLCLAEAARSPLHYRHGAIVVRGGKVIGRGHNDYRPGFNGGALKNGRIAKAGAIDGDAMMELKKKLKGKQKLQQPNQQQKQHCSTFTPFETSTGGGHSVNQPLSMHSEMMAIYSALNASSTLSSSTFSREKPCFKLPRSDKRKTRLRREVLLAYVAAVCEAAAGTGQWQVALNQALNYNNKEEDDNDNKVPQYNNKKSIAFHGKKPHATHHHENPNEKKNGKKNEYQYQYNQYGYKSNKRSARREVESDVTREHDAMSTNDYDDDDLTSITNGHDHSSDANAGASHCGGERKKDYKRSGKMRTENPTLDNEASLHQPVLLPTGRAGKHELIQRQQHSRLRGADIYVTRLGWSGKPQSKPARAKNGARRSEAQPSASFMATSTSEEDSLAESISSLTSLSVSSSHSATGSLHDELVNREPSPPRPVAPSAEECEPFDNSKIHASRPCYRCISFMHQVGIRRVYWTNDAGEWEGGKVASLIAAMDAGMESNANGDGGPTGNGVFVTKHEVLMLRRMMGSNSNGK